MTYHRARRLAPTLLLFMALVMATCVFTLSPAQAAFLRNEPQTVTQPDGTTLDCFASGDEYFNYLHDKNGYVIMQDHNTGYYVYAVEQAGNLAPTAHVAGRADPRALGLKAMATISPERYQALRAAMTPKDYKAAPRTGALNNVVVFIRFSGESEFGVTLSTYDGMFNTTTAGANSMVNYYKEASYNQLTITTRFYPTTTGAMVVSYQDSHTRSYYQPYDATTNPGGYTGGNDSEMRRTREHALLRDAVNAIASQVPAGVDIDGDNDGQVDNICFIARGATTGWSSILWPHWWALSTYNVTLQGARVYGYNLQVQNSLTSSGVGVLCHEMFHTLGGPDLYHYTGNGISPAGRWDLMDDDENPPQHMTAFMKYKYGTWIASLPEITHSGLYNLHPITSSTNNCYKIRSPNSTSEYFVVEYRKKTGAFETSVPGTGLIVYRINTTCGDGNDDGPPDELYVYRPGGTTAANGTLSTAAYSSDAGRTTFNDTSNPSDFLSSGSAGGIAITEVGAAGDTISFRVTIPAEEVRTSTREMTVNEGSYTELGIKLGKQPSANRTVSVARASGDTNLYPGTTSLTFTTTNWNTYQYVHIYAGQDADVTNGVASIRCSSSGWWSAYVTAYENDNDHAQPDLAIRSSSQRIYLGDNIYNVEASQTSNQTRTSGIRSYHYIRIQNDGNLTDTFTVKQATFYLTGATVEYFDATSGGTVITPSITGGGWSTGSIAPGGIKYIRAEITLNSTVTANAVRYVKVRATSTLDSAKIDLVRANTTKAAVTAVTLTASPASPSAVGMNINLSGAATGGGTIQYRFRVGFVSGASPTWTTIRDWNTANSCAWTPGVAGTYTVHIDARDAYATASSALREITYIVNPALSAVGLTASPPAYQVVNRNVVLTAIANNGGTVEYQFRRGYNSGGTWTWTVIREYSISRSVTWTPTLAGNYYLTVWARECGSIDRYQKYATIAYQVKPGVSAATLTAAPRSPQPINTPITLTAAVTGGARVECQFRCGYVNETTRLWVWTIIQPYAPTGACQWTPTEAHNYTVQVFAREVGCRLAYEAIGSLSFQIQ